MPPFVPLLVTTIDTPAWRAMSHGARSLYVALRRRISNDCSNNGKVYLSQRKAAAELGSHHNEIARWFRELQHYGFIAQTTAGCLGVDGQGKSPHWRLTDLGYMRDLPTRDFLHWDGIKFRDKKTESRAGNGAHKERPPPCGKSSTYLEYHLPSEETEQAKRQRREKAAKAGSSRRLAWKMGGRMPLARP